MNALRFRLKAFIACIILAVIGGLALAIGLYLLLAKSHQRRKQMRNQAYKEALKLEQRQHMQPPAWASREDIEYGEMKYTSR